MKKIFIDTNIIIDVLMKREGYLSSAKVLALAKNEDESLFVSVLTMANIAYILRKTLKGDRFYKEMAVLSDLLSVVDVTKEHFLFALELQAKDFEDALQYYCAISNMCDVLVTRNKKDFCFSSMEVMTPEELLA
ncbi:MAG: PIN domain-containing protein [Parabacteroides sp.]|nr:PIN domain-containing protein [Parabacteroides sp.]